MVFAIDDLVVIVTCLTEKRMDWYSDCERISEQEVELLNLTEASVGFLRSIVTRALPTARKEAMTDENLAKVEEIYQ